ncbi:MAG: hypothetical protein RIS29_924 [Bacteroidota bacterium]|jgi:hypothetical protein
MKKTFITLLVIFAFVITEAQNLQVHYDLGKGRSYVTTTLEMFKPDKWGNTFFFVDFDYDMGEQKHPSLAYMEIARCFSLAKTPLSFQVEYNGGLFNNSGNALPINNAYLTGLDYGWHNGDFSKTLNFKVLYKYIAGKNNPSSFQLTGVWNLHYFNKKFTASGFADFWKEDNMNFYDSKAVALSTPTNTKFVFISEPQFWYNVNEHLSVGTEEEISCNFAAVDGFKICPTLAVKWNF